MDFQITALAFNFLTEKYLHDLKKQSLSRSKPSKSILDALKHSTSLNKDFQSKIQTLNDQLTAVTQQNEFLKELIQNLKGEISYLKGQKQEKNKKLSQLQTLYKTKLQFLINQNSLLKKQIQILKTHHSLAQTVETKISKIQHPLITKKHSAAISQIKSKNHIYQPSLSDSVQSLKFKNYLNYDSANQKNQQTRPNSKLKFQFYEQQEITTPKIKQMITPKIKSSDQQCEQLANILTLKQQSKISKDFNDFIQQLSPSQRKIPSIQSITPKIVQITSQQQIYIDDDIKRVETPTLPKCFFNPCSQKQLSNGSKFKVFQEEMTTSIQGSFKPCVKNSDITFLNLETKKSIQEGIQQSMKKISIGKSSKNQIIQEKEELIMDCLQVNHNDSKYLQNLSRVDLSGLMNDIEMCSFNDGQADIEQKENRSASHQNNQSDSEDMFYKTQGFTHRKEIEKNLNQCNSKRSASVLYQNDKIKTIIDQLRESSESSGMPSIENQLPSMSSRRRSQKNGLNKGQRNLPYQRNQNIKLAVHSPYKYMSIAESFKTIEFNKSFKQLKQNQNKSKNTIDRINEIDKSNESSYLTKSRGHENNSKSSGSKSMTNSKIILYNNVRRNKKNKSLSPLSVQNRKDEGNYYESVMKSNGSQKNGKSYSLIHSIRSRKLNSSPLNSESIIVPDSTPHKDCELIPNATVILNCSTFRKKFDDVQMTQSTHPMVTFQDFDNQNEQKYN